MRLTKSLLKQIVKEELLNSQGLTTDFQEDDTVKDINPDCPHFNSQGIVIKVTPNEVTYQVTNNGKTYKDGDELTKSTDQLVKLNTNDIEEDFSVGNRKDRVSQTKKTAEVLGHEMVGEVEEPSFDLTKKKDRGDQLGESKIPLNEIRKKFFIHKISDSRLKNILLKAISKLSGAKVLKTGDDYIHLDIESKYMDVLGDFIKKYDKKRNVVIIDQFKDVVYNGKRGINKLREAKLTEGSLERAMQQWKYIEKGLKPKQKKLVQKALKRLKPKMDKYFKNKDYQDYIDGELSIKVSLPDLVFGKGKEFGQLISAYSNAIKEPEYYKFDEGIIKEEKYVVASVYGDLYTPKAVPEKQALKLMMKLAKQYAGDNVFMLGVKAWNKPHKYNKKRIKVQEGVLLEKKELDPLSIRKVAHMTDRNNHTEARIFLSAKMGWKKGIKFYKAMMELRDVFNGYGGELSKLNQKMEKELYKQLYRTYSNYDDIYNAL